MINRFVRIEVAGGDLSERRQGFFDERLFSFVGRVGIIVEQMIVASDAVIDGVGGMKLKIFPKIAGTKFGKLGHEGPISSYAGCCNFMERGIPNLMLHAEFTGSRPGFRSRTEEKPTVAVPILASDR